MRALMSVDLHLCLSQCVSLFLDNIAEMNLQMSSNSIVCKKKKKALSNQTITREINLSEFQVHMNWEIFNIKHLVLMFVC